MKTKTVFRIAVLVLCFSSVFIHYITGSLEYNDDIANAMKWHGFNSKVPHWLTLSIVGPLQVSALIMLSFNLIARNIFAVLSVVALVFTIFDGVAAYSALEMSILQLYYLSTGIVLTLAFTSLSANFRPALDEKLEQAQV